MAQFVSLILVMQIQSARFALPMILLSAGLVCILPGSTAQPPGVSGVSAAASGTGSGPHQDWPLPPTGKALHVKPDEGTVYQLDTEPLAGRGPLLLVHGGSGEHKPCFRWDRVIERLNKDPELRRRYKTFLYRYNSGSPLENNSRDLGRNLIELSKACGEKPVRIVALSMGGNLAQGALVDPAVDAVVDQVLAMGTPFHGSPLFSADWFQYSLDSSKIMPWARPVHSMDLRLYFSRHRNYLDDLKWDNLDELIPEIGRFKARLPMGPRGELTPEKAANPRLATINTAGALNKRKFVVYGGYLLNPYLQAGKHRKLEKAILAPYRYITVRLPVQLGREHPVLKLLSQEMSRLAVNPDAVLYGPPNPHAFTLNDGITPLSSALFLPPEVMKRYPILHEEDLAQLEELTDVGLARVFRNIDHVSFLDGAPPHRGSKLLRDELHPEHGQREMIDWVLDDLKRTSDFYGFEASAADACDTPASR